MEFESNMVYHFSDIFLSVQEYHKLLSNIDYSKCISSAPVKPKPGQIYICHNIKNRQDWKADQYVWRDLGFKYLPKEKPLVNCHYYKATNNSGAYFVKRAFTLFDKNEKYLPTTLIHYVGSTDNVTKRPHGNRKFNLEKHHVTTAKSVLDEQKHLLKSAPQKIYKIQTQKDCDPLLAPAFQPRDRKQVSNTVQMERKRRLLSNDDIVGVYLLYQELPSFIQTITLVKDFCVILGDVHHCRQFNELTRFQECILSYDTTFNLGDFYVSPLNYKHPLFQKEPVIPLAYLIHHKKNKDVHVSFFNAVKQMCPAIDGVHIVTDREAAINNAIRETISNSKNFYCWNHILNDVKYWIRKQKGCERKDEMVYINNTWDLLDSENMRDFENKYSQMSMQWSDRFRNYFKNNLYEAVLASGKWVLIQFNKYTYRSGITNNAAEGFNNVLKNCVERKEVNLQVLVLTLYQLDLYYQKEVARGLCNIGNYYLKDQYKCFRKEITEIQYPRSHLPLDKLPYVFTNNDFSVKHTEEERPYTNFSVAKMLLLEGCVKLVAEEKIFIVSSIASDKPPNVVTLFPKETCSCKGQRHCHHITAAKMSIGLEQQKQTYVKLSTLMRRDRGFRSGRKRAPKNLTLIEAADDSVASNTNHIKNSVLIPTVCSKGGTTVKNRFLSLSKQNSSNYNLTFLNSKPIAESTPKRQLSSSESDLEYHCEEDAEQLRKSTKKNEVLKQRRHMRPRIILSKDNDDGDYTFKYRFENNKQFFIGNACIYPINLKPLVPKENTDDMYFGDSAIDCYMNILCFENKIKLKNISVFPIEGYIINEFNRENSYFIGLSYFVKYEIAEKDIVLVPITKNNHCTLVIIIKKLKLIIYLDSLNTVLPVNIIHFLFKLYIGYAQLKNTSFSPEEWTVHVPDDVTFQKNAVDCGAFVCLFADILLTQSNCLVSHLYGASLIEYRKVIKEKLLFYMKSGEIPQISGIHISKKTSQEIENSDPTVPSFDENIKLMPVEKDTVKFLINALCEVS